MECLVTIPSAVIFLKYRISNYILKVFHGVYHVFTKKSFNFWRKMSSTGFYFSYTKCTLTWTLNRQSTKYVKKAMYILGNM